LYGVVTDVDPVCREIAVYLAGSEITLDVRCDTVITLRGERVKLRLIQPRDEVRILCREEEHGLVADRIEVRAPRASNLS
jgi:hypothetical protein